MTTRSHPAPRRGAALVAALAAAALASALLGACASSGDPADGDAVARFQDRDAKPSRRVDALETLGRGFASGEADPGAWREPIKREIWARANPPVVRIAAFDALLADESGLDDTRRMLALLLPTESALGHSDFIEHVGDVGAARGWTDLTPGLVVSWSRTVSWLEDEERPERVALEKLHPGESLVDVVFGVFLGGADGGVRERDRLAAWTLLRRLDPDGGRTTVLLAGAEAELSDEFASALTACARDLGCIPATGEELRWLIRLRARPFGSLWSKAADAVAGLDDAQRDGLQIRHAIGLVYTADARPERLALDAAALYDAMDERLADKTHYWRIGGSAPKPDELLRRARPDLVWGDLILLHAALDAVESPALAPQLFAQADADHGDTSTEHGGVMHARVPGAGSAGAEAVWTASSYPPRPNQRINDRTFVASDDLILAGTDALFHYHFHASSKTNRQYAGPSVADIEYADRHARSAIVFTFVDEDTLNADYFQPNGARVDLGAVARP